ncbi:HAD-like domain-containing protein [Cantharellus anzutake]|uniref:HAD-like domain-containing protein n=1 Tax=Cantharellus anzutake TaxID=1750568 RepID=UPI001903092A|nr:HAD-like domain-containing protein [Cantharellus anzutake]KAF8332327.1 HAD-like domain-containing protein [Cantharellus anzutake]
MIRAVFFDIGGVVVSSPLIAIHAYEKTLSLPPDYLNVQIVSRGEGGAWQQFERGELPIFEFYELFGRELSDTKKGNEWYSQHLRKKGVDPETVELPKSLAINGRELFGMMMRGAQYDRYIIEAIGHIRASKKFLTIALTNNFIEPYNSILATPPSATFTPQEELAFLGWTEGAVPKALRDLFDDFIDSSQVGMRKPEPEFFLYACKKHNLKPEEVVMLDDLGINLKAARTLGMKTILVPIGETKQAVLDLQNILDISLLSAVDTTSKL